MRQRLRTFLPIVLIALAVQILAPIASAWAAAIAAGDPLGSIAICHGGPTAPPGAAGHGPDHRDDGCLICCLAHASASFDAPNTPAFAAPGFRPAPVAWRDLAQDLPPSRAHCHGQARAPPQLS